MTPTDPKPNRAVKRLYLIDTMAYIFRAYYAPSPQRFATADGVPTQAVFLFHNMIRKLLREHKPDFVAAVYDSRGPTVRDEIFAEYKAQREPMPDDLADQLPYIERLCEALRLPIIKLEGYEADDLIGTLALKASKKGLEAVVVTSDKDLLQLVCTKPKGKHGPIRVFSPTRERFFDEAGVEDFFGVPPKQVVDVLALMGDAIDNIPGAKGIGEKGARELIRTYGSVEKAMKNHAEVKQKRYREALRDQQEQIRMSKELATLHTKLDVKLDLEAMALTDSDDDALVELYTELGFTSLLRDMLESRPTNQAKTDYREIKTAAELQTFFDKHSAASMAVWCETEGAPPNNLALTALGFAPKSGLAVSVTLPVQQGLLAGSDPQAEKLLAAARTWLEDPKRNKIVHDLKSTDHGLHSAGIGLKGVTQDTAIYSYLLQPTTSKHSLDEVAMRRLSRKLSPDPAERADTIHSLAPALQKEVRKQDLSAVCDDLDFPASSVLAEMERNGILLDAGVLQKMSRQFAKEIDSLSRRIFDKSGTEFNLNSPKQLGQVLYEKLNLPAPARRGKTKAPSTAADVLEELSAQHEVPRLVLEYRELAKLKSTYIDSLPELVDARTGRLHTSFNLFGTATGRLSSSDPNLQNIPIRTEHGTRIRKAFVAGKGCVLLGADYSQIELRVLAHLSGDKVLIDAFQRGEDIHARTAEEVLGVAAGLQTSEHRRVAKMINFGIVYGLTAFGLATRLGIPQSEAKQYIDAYFERYSGVREFCDQLLEQTRKDGYTATLHGRRRPIPDLDSRNLAQRSFAERTALNSPIQGTAADLIKVAMIRIQRKLHELRFEARMLLQVHDELVFEVPKKELPRLEKLVREEMESAHELAVPLLVDIHSGPDWAALK